MTGQNFGRPASSIVLACIEYSCLKEQSSNLAWVLVQQWCMVRELFELARKGQQEKLLPGFRAQQWYFFGVATFYVYLR